MLELKKFLLLCLLCISSLNIFAHNHLSHDDLRTWTIAKKDIKASFLLQRNDTVYLEQKHALLHVAFKNLSKFTPFTLYFEIKILLKPKRSASCMR